MNALVSIIIAPVTGYLADKVYWKNSLMISCWVVNILGTAITAWSATCTSMVTFVNRYLMAGVIVAGLLIGRLIQTFAGSIIWIAGMAILGARAGSNHLAKAFSIVTLFASAGALSGPALSGALFQFASYSVTWLSALLMLAVGILIQSLVIERVTEVDPKPADNIYVYNEAGGMFLLLQAPSLILAIPAGWLKDRIGMRLPATLGFLLMGAFLWFLGVPGNENFAWAADPRTGEAIYIVTLVGIGVSRTLLLGFGGVEVLSESRCYPTLSYYLTYSNICN